MPLKARILGCGSSGGVPRVGGDWGVCDPANPKNRRTRCSLLVSYWATGPEPDIKEQTTVLIDTSPDLREQLLSAKTKRLDAVLYTHDHADQTHGIDDLRAIAYRMRQRIPAYMDGHSKIHLFDRFKYCFEMPDGRVHPPILELQTLIKNGDKLSIAGPGGMVSIDVLELSHGPTPSLGFIFDGKLAYSPDVWDVPDYSLNRLNNIPIWIVDALRYSDHPTHANADKTLAWFAKTKTRQGILTNLHIDMDYSVLSQELPGNHQVAYDSMELSI